VCVGMCVRACVWVGVCVRCVGVCVCGCVCGWVCVCDAHSESMPLFRQQNTLSVLCLRTVYCCPCFDFKSNSNYIWYLKLCSGETGREMGCEV